MIVVMTALNAVFQTALYLYATTGSVADRFRELEPAQQLRAPLSGVGSAGGRA